MRAGVWLIRAAPLAPGFWLLTPKLITDLLITDH